MNTMKKLPSTMTVVTALRLISAITQEFTQEQIDVIATKTADKALVDRQAEIDAVASKKVDMIINPQTIAVLPDTVIPFGLKFNGYARRGAHFQTGDQKYVNVGGLYNGASAIGRFGNEGSGGEFQISKVFKSAQGAIWDLNAMFDHWSDEANLKKAYVGVTNVLESNPNAYVWVGRDFHQRPQQGINDHLWVDHDGQGAGVKNLDIGGAQSDAATVSQMKSCNPEVMVDETNPSHITYADSSDTGDSGYHALTTKTYNTKAGPTDIEVYANYGLDSKTTDSDARLGARQGDLVLSHTNDSGTNRVILRYSDNSDGSVYNKADDLIIVYASFKNSHKFIQQAQIGHLLTFHDYDGGEDNTDNHKNYGAIVQPVYFWNDVYFTWLETGYQRADYDQGGDNHSQRLTLSQSIAIDMGPGFRLMLRFYVTGGQVDSEHTARVDGIQDQQLDSLNVDGMFGAWP